MFQPDSTQIFIAAVPTIVFAIIVFVVRFDHLVHDAERTTNDRHSETMRVGRPTETLAEKTQTQPLMIREKPIEMVEIQQEH